MRGWGVGAVGREEEFVKFEDQVFPKRASLSRQRLKKILGKSRLDNL